VVYRSFKLNTAFLVTLFLVSVWNGASYYMEVFSKQYERELNKLATEVTNAVAANQLAHDNAEHEQHQEEQQEKTEVAVAAPKSASDKKTD
jgi:sensor histidine kinase regulating citrate/malate metabolism